MHIHTCKISAGRTRTQKEIWGERGERERERKREIVREQGRACTCLKEANPPNIFWKSSALHSGSGLMHGLQQQRYLKAFVRFQRFRKDLCNQCPSSIHTSGNKHIGNSAFNKELQYHGGSRDSSRASTHSGRARARSAGGVLEECYTNLKPAVGKLVLLQIKLLDAAVILRNPT